MSLLIRQNFYPTASSFAILSKIKYWTSKVVGFFETPPFNSYYTQCANTLLMGTIHHLRRNTIALRSVKSNHVSKKKKHFKWVPYSQFNILFLKIRHTTILREDFRKHLSFINSMTTFVHFSCFSLLYRARYKHSNNNNVHTFNFSFIDRYTKTINKWTCWTKSATWKW